MKVIRYNARNMDGHGRVGAKVCSLSAFHEKSDKELRGLRSFV